MAETAVAAAPQAAKQVELSTAQKAAAEGCPAKQVMTTLPTYSSMERKASMSRSTSTS